MAGAVRSFGSVKSQDLTFYAVLNQFDALKPLGTQILTALAALQSSSVVVVTAVQA